MADDKVAPPSAGSRPTYEIFDWIDGNLFTAILHKHLAGAAFELVDHVTDYATKKGENYGSAMFRATVTFKRTATRDDATTEQLNLILKANLDDPLMDEFTTELAMATKERIVYERLLPEAYRLLRDTEFDTVLAPRALYYDDKVIVMEDLSVDGYKMADIRKKLGFDECRVVVKKMAIFHGAMAVVAQNNCQAFGQHLQGIITAETVHYHALFRNLVDCSLNYLKTRPALQQVAAKLEARFSADLVERLVKIFQRDAARFNTLTHGDLWANNVLINATRDEIRFVDFQEGMYGSPAIDWNYLLFTSCQPDVLCIHLDELIAIYQQDLQAVLSRLGYAKQVPTVDDIRADIIDKIDHGLISLLGYAPVMANENRELADAMFYILDTEECREVRRKVFANEEQAKIVEALIPVFERFGVL